MVDVHGFEEESQGPSRIGFSTTNAPISRLIRAVTRSRVSHCFMIDWHPGWKKDIVLEAHESGFRVVTLAQFEKHNIIVRIIPVNGLDLGIRHVVDLLGRGYDFPGLLGMAAVLSGRAITGRKLRNPFQNGASPFCSEICVAALQFCGFPGARTLDAGSTSPQDLMDFLLNAQG